MERRESMKEIDLKSNSGTWRALSWGLAVFAFFWTLAAPVLADPLSDAKRAVRVREGHPGMSASGGG
ncbi:MAG: hypothetical protein ACE5ER_11685, partial [Nitrospinaceae bacterium]